MTSELNVTTVNSWTEIPNLGGVTIHTTSELTAAQVANAILWSEQWQPFGYNTAYLCNSTKTIHLFR